jgi:hypothetical protein
MSVDGLLERIGNLSGLEQSGLELAPNPVVFSKERVHAVA